MTRKVSPETTGDSSRENASTPVLHSGNSSPERHIPPTGLKMQLALTFAVVLFGCANNIAKQIAAKPLQRYTYILGLSTAVIYVPLYGSVLATLYFFGSVPRQQLDFAKSCDSSGRIPTILLFLVASLGDTLGDVIGMICTPYVAGPVHSLLSNCTPMFIAVLSIMFLRKRYSLAQCLGLLGVVSAVTIGVLPSFDSKTANATNPFFALVLGGSCLFNAVSFVVKELIFDRYKHWTSDRLLSDGAQGLNVFVVNTLAACFQLPLTLLTMPLNVVLKQTNGEPLLKYMHEALSCIFASSGSACQTDAAAAQENVAGTCVLVYIIFNVLWNISVILSVKHSGALTTFVALKAIFPISTILFAYVDWPLLGPTALNWLVWVSVLLMIPSIALYQWASGKQQQRFQQHPSQATCCWPLCNSRARGSRSSD
mmetsp:Transcript_33436/g.71644  ORF Transcript_33436/g.71644 Transcript_33436/m.71644 type:complete len:426 (-) Transcript_33436:67-1344(-)|eukprot:CAMPEP_0206438300 /NCGR_PEP_ID=MMETSP0324_2-20121206/11550_1 /ASSEMBLY_ACC=CAM_ASM_000836 /TAXON_ID=2866 /ORGANISM="Crypthecodinium cohnii, Strain Seligo" /LENGTH=425 /DNA_ID=CAMNT_0053905737 /DNA_START=34 /DNA_END=1311 /DNA_ORIENTATION=+